MFLSGSKRWFVALALALVSIAMLAVLLSSQHRIRLIVGSYKVVDSMVNIPANESMRYMAQPTGDFKTAVSVLSEFDKLHPLKAEEALPAVDQPDSCVELLQKGRMLHCYNVDIATATILSRYGVAARLWDMTGPKQLGGYGHNMLEVFDHTSGTWRALDPYYHCYYTLKNDSIPLSFPNLRLALLTDPKSVSIVHYSDTERSRPDFYMFAELCYLAPGAMLHSNNDFRWRYDHRYTWLGMFAPMFDAMPLRFSRGIRMMMLGKRDRRFVIEDRYSPHYPFHLMKALFLGLILLLFLSVIGYIGSAKWRRHSVKARENETALVRDLMSTDQ